MSGEHPCRLYYQTTGSPGGFMEFPSPSPMASEDDDDFDDDDDDEDGDASSPSDDEMSTWCTYPFVTRDKKGE